jgi:hypothetical protein
MILLLPWKSFHHCVDNFFFSSNAIFPIIHAYCCVLTADVLYDLGTALEVVSPLCPQLFLEVAGLGNFAKVAFLTGIAPFRLQNIDIYNLLFLFCMHSCVLVFMNK